MNTVRIHGLVKYANRIKDELCQPVSGIRLSKLKTEVGSSLESLNRVLKKANTVYEKLPPQSRKAYEFLAGIDFESINPAQQSVEHKFRPKSVSFPRLGGYFEHILNQLASETKKDKLEHIRASIVNSSNHLERQIIAENIAPEHLKSASRDIRGWLVYFSDNDNFNEYADAIQRALSAFDTRKPKSKQIVIHFCPIKAIYRVRSLGDAVIIKLSTPMISLADNDFGHMAAMLFDREPRKEQLHAAICGEPYQRILRELELLGGLIERTKGVYYDLADSFQRVNAKYFNGTLCQPRLVWSTTFNSRKFGHYDHPHDTVMINSTLDSSRVSQYTIDFIMYHELLHKKLNVKWKNKTRISHSPEFRLEENKFEQLAEAKKELNGMAQAENSKAKSLYDLCNTASFM